MQNAIGLIETKGLLALIEATDAMAKAANVEIVKNHHRSRQFEIRQIELGPAVRLVRRSHSRCG